MFYDILITHALTFPKMEVVDYFKLCYQSEFGVNHFINKKCFDYLYDEYKTTEHDGDFPKYIYIGNDLYRVNLQPLPYEKLDCLGNAFIGTSEITQGTICGMTKKLDVLNKLVLEKPELFEFSYSSFSEQLKRYSDFGFPPLHHSETFRKQYKPAYRVIHKDYMSIIYTT